LVNKENFDNIKLHGANVGGGGEPGIQFVF